MYLNLKCLLNLTQETDGLENHVSSVSRLGFKRKCALHMFQGGHGTEKTGDLDVNCLKILLLKW